LYLSTHKIEGYCNPESMKIDDFMFNDKRIYCTKLELCKHQIRFAFVLDSYNIDTLLVNLYAAEIPLFIQWKKRYFPSRIKSHVNVLDVEPDTVSALYALGTDMDLLITGHFSPSFITVLHIVT